MFLEVKYPWLCFSRVSRQSNKAGVQRSQIDSQSGIITWEYYGTCLAGTNFETVRRQELLVHSFKEQLWPGNMLQYQNLCNEVSTGDCMKVDPTLQYRIPDISDTRTVGFLFRKASGVE